jgi:lipoyl(octanoyl) transferase
MISKSPVAYEEAVSFMERRAAEIHAGTAPDTLWLCEHPALYTAGTSASEDEILDDRLPVHHTGRGGRVTYHGPGQKIGYVMVDLKRRGEDVRAFVGDLEAWLIGALAHFGVTAERRQGRIGLWVARDDGREDKIAAIGVRIRHWVSFHGAALNVAPDLSHYQGIVPCGIRDHGVTSLKELGIEADMAEVDAVLGECFEKTFNTSLVPTSAPIQIR